MTAYNAPPPPRARWALLGHAPRCPPGPLDAARVLFAGWAVCVPQLGRLGGDSHFSGLGEAATVARKRKLPAVSTTTFVSHIPPS